MTKEQIEKWARKEGRALPRLKSSEKYGMQRSTLLDRDTWEESYQALSEWGKDKGLIYPPLT